MKLKNGTNGFCRVLRVEDTAETPQAITIARNIERWHQEQHERARARLRARQAQELACRQRIGAWWVGRGLAEALTGVRV